MYMNNRAAESLAEGRVNDAYWWARAAIEEDPRFMSAYNTLGVTYRRHGNPQEAERVLSLVLELEPGNTLAMSNLALVLNDQGRAGEASALTRKLEQLQPYPRSISSNSAWPPCVKRFQGSKGAVREGSQRDAYYHEFRAWLAAALSLRLRTPESARATRDRPRQQRHAQRARPLRR
jgi:tetratricopeptide (TPR) repeat protein